MYFDYHVHTSFSSDSSMEMEKCLNHAVEREIDILCFTDHHDIDYPGDESFDFKYTEYSESIKKCRERFSESITINKGIELGIQSHITDELNEFLADKEFDFIIGSIHAVNRKDLYWGDFYRDKGKHEAYGEYFEYLYKTINGFKNFDVLGHLDIIRRYGSYDDKSLLYKDYKDIIDTILKELIHSGRGIEVNTSGLRNPLGIPNPSMEIISAYKNLGGDIITTGSDSHDYSHLASNFNNVYEMLCQCGFKYVTVFKERKPIQMRI